ncbi:MAG: Uma2 family endonuclease [Deltaproteobacteria bacterium]|nr:Uma2 family endonuclease [Deltaproteobacteria bacterium]
MDPKTPNNNGWTVPGHRTGPFGEPLDDPRPRVDQRLVEPETAYEVVRGERVQASPSNPDHADPHMQLDAVVFTHLRPGWRGATDLLTRTDERSDFATDASVRREGIDPTTGARYLEEVAFEVVNTQRAGDLTAKAQDLTARGVRRVFGLWPRQKRICEWRGGVWQVLPLASVIDDECFARPIPVQALLDASAADDALADALLARGNSRLAAVVASAAHQGEARGEARGEVRGEARGEAQGKAAALLAVLQARGLDVDEDARQRITACADSALLSVWITRAVTATALADVLDASTP